MGLEPGFLTVLILLKVFDHIPDGSGGYSCTYQGLHFPTGHSLSFYQAVGLNKILADRKAQINGIQWDLMAMGDQEIGLL